MPVLLLTAGTAQTLNSSNAYPINTWKLEGSVAFLFPEGLVLSPGEYLLITETNEAAFRSYYTVEAGVTVLGPYDGKLNNDGEDLKLTRPGAPEVLTGKVPSILVELVDYDDKAPCPVVTVFRGAHRSPAALGSLPLVSRSDRDDPVPV